VKILFLDIDGVLNCTQWQLSWTKPPRYENMPKWQKDAERSIDPEKVALLNIIVDETSCAVVLSSTWRKEYPLPTMERILRYKGFKHNLFACTPHIYDPKRFVERGEEISLWLKQIPFPTTIAILDDDSDINPHMDKLVRTDFGVGLTDRDADKAISILNEYAR